ncbi:putative acyl-CoA dehydrogenase 6 isoform X2 [Dermacentor variabilis]|uniref:putative acyl-CoA dehydrogenase 6 isoform X2 n=1 Tax=Dermacentor variabilis TaxID=34621 RepID=UPI003F5B3252
MSFDGAFARSLTRTSTHTWTSGRQRACTMLTRCSRSWPRVRRSWSGLQLYGSLCGGAVCHQLWWHCLGDPGPHGHVYPCPFQFLAPSIAGDIVGCVGVSEPDCGSDVASIKTTAVRQGDDLVINGGKMWITNGCQADWMAVLVNTRTEGPPHKTKSLICLPLKTPGVTVARSIKKLGHRSSDTAQIFFEDVRVPAKNIVGEEGMGFVYQMLQFQDERLVAAINSVTFMERMINETLEYCQQRKVYGQPLIKNQVIQFRLAELQTEVEALRSLGYRGAALLMSGENVTELASMAKLKAGRLVREVADTCLQYWGGMGYTEEMPMARAFRDSRLLSIAGGADEVMLSIIAKLRWGVGR